MIVVTIEPNEVNIRGHSGYAESGKDIVCAAVSALLQTTIKSVHDLTEDQIEYNLSPGNANIVYEDLSERAKTLIDSFFIGICLIAEEYPDYIRVA